jgi:hypothetical protein
MEVSDAFGPSAAVAEFQPHGVPRPAVRSFGFQKKNLGRVAGKCDLVKKIGNIKSCTSLVPMPLQNENKIK